MTTLRSQLCTARRYAYTSTACNPRAQSLTLIVGNPETTITCTGPLTERASKSSRSAVTTVTNTHRNASVVISRADLPELVEIKPGYYGRCIDEEGTDWRIIARAYADDAVYRLTLSVATATGAGKTQPLPGA